jgi:ActR/RegA family two-component response regulator
VLAIVEADMLEDAPPPSETRTLDRSKHEAVASAYLRNGRNATKTARELDLRARSTGCSSRRRRFAKTWR